jgi:cell division protein FtsB
VNSTRFLALFALASVAAGVAFVVHLALRFQNVAMGYEVERARNEAVRLRAQVNEVRLELAARQAPAALETIAREELHMIEPDRVPTLTVGGPLRPQRTSGRPQ